MARKGVKRGQKGVSPEVGYKFARWTVGHAQYTNNLADIEAAETTFIMPNETVTVTANYRFITLEEGLDNDELDWITGGDATWIPQIAETHDGIDAAQSGLITHNQTAWIETTVSGAGTISFWWRVSCEEPYKGIAFDRLRLFLGGTEQLYICGEVDWQFVSLEVPDEGSHVLRWDYYKDESYTSGSDCGWVDQVVWMPADGFANWANQYGMDGDAAALFSQDRNGDGIPNGFEYAYGTNAFLLNLKMVNGRPVVETLAQDATTLPHVTVRVLGSTNMVDWTLPISPTNGASTGRAWFRAEDQPSKAFFKLEAELK